MMNILELLKLKINIKSNTPQKYISGIDIAAAVQINIGVG